MEVCTKQIENEPSKIEIVFLYSNHSANTAQRKIVEEITRLCLESYDLGEKIKTAERAIRNAKTLQELAQVGKHESIVRLNRERRDGLRAQIAELEKTPGLEEYLALDNQ